MRNKNISNFIMTFVFIIIIGVGYAAINNINLIINGTGSVTATQSNFKVKFLDADGHRPSITPGSPNTVSVIDNTTALFDVSTLSKKGDTAIATIDVKNESNGVGARIGLNLTNSNTTYFKVTEHIADTELQAGDITTVTVTIEMLKTPISADETTNITATLTASPIENSTATENSQTTKVVPGPVAFSSDSWETIKNAIHNDYADAYNVGDTKTIYMDLDNNGEGEPYTLRISNTSKSSNCINSNYSETACGFVVEFVDIVAKMTMYGSHTNLGGYSQSNVRIYLNSLFGKLPVELQETIDTTRVVSGYGCVSGWNSTNLTCSNPDNNGANYITETDKLYLLSGTEVFGNDSYDTASNTTTQLDYYRGMTQTGTMYSEPTYDRVIKSYNNTNDVWWLRSPYSSDKIYFRAVYQYGGIGQNGAANSYGVSPAFRIE